MKPMHDDFPMTFYKGHVYDGHTEIIARVERLPGWVGPANISVWRDDNPESNEDLFLVAGQRFAYCIQDDVLDEMTCEPTQIIEDTLGMWYPLHAVAIGILVGMESAAR